MSLFGYIYFSSSFRSRLFVERLRNRLYLLMRRTLGAFLFFIFTAAGVNAQNVNGSVYSYFGIGPLQVRSSAYNRALGYTGVGVRDDGADAERVFDDSSLADREAGRPRLSDRLAQDFFIDARVVS